MKNEKLRMENIKKKQVILHYSFLILH